MTSRKPVTIRAVGRRSTQFEGPGVVQGCTDLRITKMRSRFGGGWLVAQQHADDLMALLESRGFKVVIEL